MAPTTVEHRRQVLEAATKRLAAAKAQKASARENIRSAKAVIKIAQENMDTATKAMDAAKKELKAAEEFLNSVNANWEVIDIDAESQANENQSIQVIGSDADASDQSQVGDDVDSEEKESEDGDILKDGDESKKGDEPDADSNVESGENECKRLVVKRCGIPEVNGTYKREGTYNGVPQYAKGKDTSKIRIYFVRPFNRWYISSRGECIYRARAKADQPDGPPIKGWKACNDAHGKLPAPRLKWLDEW